MALRTLASLILHLPASSSLCFYLTPHPLRSYISLSIGKIDNGGRITVDLVDTFAEWFSAGFIELPGTPIL
jgi:hypothetical protein